MDNQEKNTIIMQDEDGNKIEVEILFSYEDESTEKVYVFLVDYTDNTIIIGELKDDNSIIILGPETEDFLKDKLQAVYNDLLDKHIKMMKSHNVVVDTITTITITMVNVVKAIVTAVKKIIAVAIITNKKTSACWLRFFKLQI